MTRARHWVSRYPGIAADLRDRVLGGEWEPGATMPRMSDLARGYGVNRDTLARAVAILEAEGLIWAVPRRGTIVRHGMSRPRRLRGNLVKRNLATDSPGYSFPSASGQEVWKHRITPVARHEKLTDPRLARMLGVPEGTEVIRPGGREPGVRGPHVDHDDSDVVRPPGLLGQGGELADGFGCGGGRRQHVPDRPGIHDWAQPVRAQQVTVSRPQVPQAQISRTVWPPVQVTCEYWREETGVPETSLPIVWSSVIWRSWPSRSRNARESPMCASAARSPENSIAVSVVPMPCREESSAARRATALFASAAARPRTWTMASGATSASCERSDSITAALATSPAAWPPRPSATANSQRPA